MICWEPVPLAYLNTIEPCETCGRTTRPTEYAPPRTGHGLYDLRYHCRCERTWVITGQVTPCIGDTVVKEYEPDRFVIEEIFPEGRRTLQTGLVELGAAHAIAREALSRSGGLWVWVCHYQEHELRFW